MKETVQCEAMFHVINFFIEFFGNYQAIEKIYETLNMYFDESYNICLIHFLQFSVFLKINAKNHDFHGFYHENRLSVIFTIIFVISVPKNVNTHSFKKIGGITFSKLYPPLLQKIHKYRQILRYLCNIKIL